jgi:cobalamin biosynthesis protein CobW
VRAFNWPGIKSAVTVDGVLTVVDAKALAEGRFADDEEAVAAQRKANPNLDHENPIEELFEDQLNAADMVILNKTDLLTADELATMSNALKSQIRAATRLVPANHGKLEPDILLGLKAGAEGDMGNRLSHHEMEGEVQHDHDDFVTFIVDLAGPQYRDSLLNRILKTIETHDILRLKGFASLKDAGARLLVQAVGPRLNTYFDRDWNKGEARTTRLVVIGEKHIDQAAIAASLQG